MKNIGKRNVMIVAALAAAAVGAHSTYRQYKEYQSQLWMAAHDISTYSSLLNQERNNLSSNSAYYNSACNQPMEPSTTCSTMAKAKEAAIVYCGFQWKGCDGVASLLGGKANSDVVKYISNVGCGSLAAQLTGREYTAENLVHDTLDALAESTCKEEKGSGSFLGIASCLFSLYSSVSKQMELNECIDRESSGCKSNFDYKYGLYEAELANYRECASALSNVQRYDSKIADARMKQREIRGKPISKIFGLQ